MHILLTLVIFLVVIVVLVVAHELGHFFMAKFFGVTVEEFGLGYPPRAKKLFVWKNTLFTLNWLPFGGFVKIFGENEDGNTDEQNLPNAFSNQKLWKRLSILVAGIAANLVLAVILYAASFSVGFLDNPIYYPNAHVVSTPSLTVIGIVDNTPASKSGLKANDKVVSLASGLDTSTTQTFEGFTEFVQMHPTSPIAITVERGQQDMTFTMTPQANLVEGKPGIGVAVEPIALMRVPFLKAVPLGFENTIAEFKEIVGTLYTLIVQLFSGNGTLAGQLSGPVGIAKFAGSAAALGIGSLLAFMAVISVNLAVVNLLPFPALDGGRMVLELFTSKGKSKISSKIVGWIIQIGFLILIILMLFVTYHDIFHPL